MRASALAVLAGLCLVHASPAIVDLGNVTASYGGFATVYNGTLYASSFYPGSVISVPGIASIVSSASHSLSAAVPNTAFSSSIVWPNHLEPAPSSSVFGRAAGVVAGGFISPGFNTGALTAIDLSNPSAAPAERFKMTATLSGWFYHKALFVDVDNDGLLDVVAARSNYSATSTATPLGQLIWLRHPSAGAEAWNVMWEENVLFVGPDVNFDIADLNNDSVWEVVAAQYFANAGLWVYWTEGNYTHGPWKSRAIDQSLGGMMAAIASVDVDGDGEIDIVATTHSSNSTRAGCFAYSVPSDLSADNFTRYTLVNGIVTTLSGSTQASPGIPVPFYPYSDSADVPDVYTRPTILLPGDGAQNVMLLKPTGTSGWVYETEVVITWTGTAGGAAVSDTDGDHYAEFFVPNYNKNYIHGWKFAPEASSSAAEAQVSSSIQQGVSSSVVPASSEKAVSSEHVIISSEKAASSEKVISSEHVVASSGKVAVSSEKASSAGAHTSSAEEKAASSSHPQKTSSAASPASSSVVTPSTHSSDISGASSLLFGASLALSAVVSVCL